MALAVEAVSLSSPDPSPLLFAAEGCSPVEAAPCSSPSRYDPQGRPHQVSSRPSSQPQPQEAGRQGRWHQSRPTSCPVQCKPALVRRRSTSIDIPRLPRAATSCPSILDEEIVAAALEAPERTLSCLNLSHWEAAMAATTPLAESPNSTLGSSTSSGLPRGLPRGSPHRPLRGSLSNLESAARLIFEAQGDAANASAQVSCLREALMKERERVAFLTAELERVTTERDELQRGSAFAGGDEEGEVLGVMFEGDEAGEGEEGEEHGGDSGGEDDWVGPADGQQQWGGAEVGEPESWVVDSSSATAATRLAAGGAGGEPSNRTPSCHVV